MKEKNDLVSIYTGTEVAAILLKGKLDRVGVSSMIKKVSNAGTWGIVPDNIELFVESADKDIAGEVISGFNPESKT